MIAKLATKGIFGAGVVLGTVIAAHSGHRRPVRPDHGPPDPAALPVPLRGAVMRTLRVGQDLDGVNFWFDRAYYTGCRALGLIHPSQPHRIARHWEFYEDYDHDLATFLTNCDTLADAGLLWDGPMIPGAASAWDHLADMGHEIHIITDRRFGTHPVASEVGTRMWLRAHGRRYHSLKFSPNKAAVPTDVMLEDKIENYDDLADTDCTPVLINRLWNQVPGGDDRLRVNTHDQFLTIVANLANGAAAA